VKRILKREATLRVTTQNSSFLTRSFASRFFASLRSAIFSENERADYFVSLPEGVKARSKASRQNILDFDF
jgi:hypothetical protein